MKGKHPTAPQMATPDLIRRPLRDMIAALAQLPMTPSGETDFTEAEPDVLVRLAESAELTLQILYDGLASMGLLYSLSAHQLEDGRVRAAHTVAVGLLQAEIGGLLPYLNRLSSECRRYTADYEG